MESKEKEDTEENREEKRKQDATDFATGHSHTNKIYLQKKQ